MQGLFRVVMAVLVLIGAGYLLKSYVAGNEKRDVASVEFDELVVALRQNENRLNVYKLTGSVTTKANTPGGWGDVLHGEMTVKQPFTVNYFANMADLTLEDYVWDAATRTLLIRAPDVSPDPPNIDESEQVVVYKGAIITRDMQTRLRRGIAAGAKKQVTAEAAKPENMAAAMRGARKAIAHNLVGPLQAAGLKNVSVVVRTPTDGDPNNHEQWDLSRSMAEVLAERAAR